MAQETIKRKLRKTVCIGIGAVGLAAAGCGPGTKAPDESYVRQHLGEDALRLYDNLVNILDREYRRSDARGYHTANDEMEMSEEEFQKAIGVTSSRIDNIITAIYSILDEKRAHLFEAEAQECYSRSMELCIEARNIIQSAGDPDDKECKRLDKIEKELANLGNQLDGIYCSHIWAISRAYQEKASEMDPQSKLELQGDIGSAIEYGGNWHDVINKKSEQKPYQGIVHNGALL